MALVFFSWVDGDGKAHDLLLDASPSRQHVASAQVTSHPVERGAPVTDYIRPLPRRLTIEGFITNTPIGAPPGGGNNGVTSTNRGYEIVVYPNVLRGPRALTWQGLGFSAEFDRVQSAFLDLVAAVQGGALFSISMSLVDYNNMAATQLTVSESSTAADALNFSIEFEELRFATTSIVAVPVRKSVHAGPKTPENADADPAKKKALQSTISAIVSGPDAP